jgi:hypothetical protein
MSEGRIHASLNTEVVNRCVGLLEALEAELAFLIRLTPAEKSRLVKPRAGAKEVMQGIAELQRDAGMPLDADDPMLADMGVFAGLTTIGDLVTSLQHRIEDTKLLAGSEGWNESLIRYGMLRHAQRRNPDLKAGLDRLRPLITSRSNRPAPGPIEDEPETPVTPEPTPAK